MKYNTFLLCAALLLATSSVMAHDEPAKKKESPWTTSAELGYVETSGNTNTQTAVFKFDTEYEIEKWKHQGHLATLNSEADNVKTADATLLSLQSDYKFTPRDYFLGVFVFEDNKFSGFDYNAKLSLGYGRKILMLDRHKLDGEIGPGYRNFKVDNAPSSEDEALLRLAAKYKWLISDNSEFKQDFVADFGEDQDEWRSTTALKSNINKTLAMKLTYMVRYYKLVPVGNNNYDRETAVTLVYTF